MKIDVRCGFGGRKPCGNWVGEIDREGFPGPLWFRGGNYDRLRWEERDYNCDKHGALQVYDEACCAWRSSPGGATRSWPRACPGDEVERFQGGTVPRLDRTAQRCRMTQA